jgi:hypothetical protein
VQQKNPCNVKVGLDFFAKILAKSLASRISLQENNYTAQAI